MDLDEWYEGVQRWRQPPARSHWRRAPALTVVALLAAVLAVGAARLGAGGSDPEGDEAASASLSLPVTDVTTPSTARRGATSSSASPSSTSASSTPPTTAAPATASPPPTTAPPAPPAPPPPAPPTTLVAAARPTAPPTTARPAPPPPLPPTTAAPAPPPTQAPAPPQQSTGRLSARMGVSRSPATVGQPVTFTASWNDTNGQLASMGIEFGDGSGANRNGGPCGAGAAGSRSGTEAFTHTFRAPGTYTVRLHVHTDDCTGGRQAAVVTLTLRVQ